MDGTSMTADMVDRADEETLPSHHNMALAKNLGRGAH